MGESIFFLNGQKAVALREAPYAYEKDLQDLITHHPEILDGVLTPPGGGCNWILVKQEMGVPDHDEGSDRWFLDHLLLDLAYGIPTLVEVKRSTDTRIRREVVAQMLDYAANGCDYWSTVTIRTNYEDWCEKTGKNPLAEQYPDEESVDDYWAQVEENLRSKKIRLLFVADQIPGSLRQIIEFMNEQMVQAEVLGVEVRQYISDQGQRVLAPRVLGRTTPAQRVKREAGFAWTEESYLARAMAVGGEAQEEVCQQLLRGFEQMGFYIYWGQGRKQPGFVATYIGKKRHQLCAVYVYTNHIGVELYFKHFKAPFDQAEKQRELQAHFNAIPGIRVEDDCGKKLPSFDCKILLDPQNRQRFLDVYRSMVEEIKAYEAGL